MSDNVTNITKRAPKPNPMADELAHLRSENARLAAELGGLRAADIKPRHTSFLAGFAIGAGLIGLTMFVAGAGLGAAFVRDVQLQTLPIAQEAVMRGAVVAGIVHGKDVTPQQMGGGQ